MMERQDFLDLGFTELPHFTIGSSLTYDFGRNRYLSASSVGSPNEMIFIYEISKNNPNEITDVICIHNYDYNGYMTKEKLVKLIDFLK